LQHVIPTKDKTASPKMPPRIATFNVAIVLLSIGLLYLLKGGIISLDIPSKWINYAAWFVPFIFFLRAIGEFRYVGLFKRIKDTDFAKADTKLFVPLCLGIAILGFMIQFFS